jgi:hypothetical protein
MGNERALGGIGAGKIATAVIAAFVAGLLAAGCGSEQTPSPPEQTPSPPEQTPSAPVVVAAGDIADCRTEGDEAAVEATAELVNDI